MITIIGAGPIGCYTAYLLASSGKTVQVFEKKSKIGIPVQCTGLVTKKILKYIDLPKKTIANKVDNIIVKSHDKVKFKLKRPELVLHRDKFDQYLYNLAKSKGVSFNLNHCFEKIQGPYIIVSHKNKKKKIKTDILIGADGANSKVRNLINKKRTSSEIGMQALINYKNKKNTYKVFLGKRYGTFAWIVPESENRARAGILTKDQKKFKNFLNEINAKPIKYISGIIPLYKNLNINKKNIFLVGDAALTVKNTTSGGIVYGLMSAKFLVDAINKKKDYRKLFNKKVRKGLILHNIIYKTMNYLTDKEYNKIILYCRKKRVKRIIENSDREHPLKMLTKIIFVHPLFLLLLPKVIFRAILKKIL
jgi:geranylgeranyl reductase family protein